MLIVIIYSLGQSDHIKQHFYACLSVGERAAQSILNIGHEFTEYATIQGLAYIFSKNISVFGRLYWLFSVAGMISLGLFWTADMYITWQGQQVLFRIYFI
jgi:hypothetical protein